ncbi:DnaJ domain-containing protein [Methylomonas sp. SURF-1]|uniref:DnaJ domain-containing protein n=1 Tax=Methylomonas aurea TaxID=2952224 RepID=A0ABT1UJB6_9GAMM|nr:DnaJ domain-containing protein [Methylomonas sp. SURF-1]MCQ8182339.1 DnaJ domain-containing protein [Methylomonas sp. SURF-1]
MALIIGVFVYRWYAKTPSEEVRRQLRRILWLLASVLLAGALLTGKLNGLVALAGVLLAFIARMMPALINYAPQLHRLWRLFRESPDGRRQSPRAPGPDMTRDQALQILGLKPGATEQEIVAAHRSLISKMHPDRGGSDYLAAQINQAKKILLGG